MPKKAKKKNKNESKQLGMYIQSVKVHISEPSLPAGAHVDERQNNADSAPQSS